MIQLGNVFADPHEFTNIIRAEFTHIFNQFLCARQQVRRCKFSNTDRRLVIEGFGGGYHGQHSKRASKRTIHGPRDCRPLSAGYDTLPANNQKVPHTMHPLQHAVWAIDHFTEACGRALAWFCLIMALLTGLIVLLRYGFGIGSIAAQESVTYLHSALFMLGAAFTLKRDGHVRVDIFYRNFSERGRAWVNSIGTVLFLIPLCLFILGISWQFVGQAWAIREASPEPGGIPAVFLLKSLMPAMALLLLLQAVAELLRNALILVGAKSADADT